MCRTLDNLLGKIVGYIIVMFLLYFMFVWLPVVLYTETQCLSKGYPEYKVAINLDSYCLTLDGAITVKVDKI